MKIYYRKQRVIWANHNRLAKRTLDRKHESERKSRFGPLRRKQIKLHRKAQGKNAWQGFGKGAYQRNRRVTKLKRWAKRMEILMLLAKGYPVTDPSAEYLIKTSYEPTEETPKESLSNMFGQEDWSDPTKDVSLAKSEDVPEQSKAELLEIIKNLQKKLETHHAGNAPAEFANPVDSVKSTIPIKPDRPTPEAQLTPEQRRIRQLEDQLARAQGEKDPERELERPVGKEGEKVLIHFAADGLTSLGQVWYRGQELEIVIGSGAYQDTCDRTGWSWLSLVDDEFGQMNRWGRVMFRRGPWRGGSYSDDRREALSGITSPSQEELLAASRAEASRGRAAPRLPRL
jgi:hypothetical protein